MNYYISMAGVTIICTSKESVLGWIDYAIDHGYAPKVEVL